jgi:serine/threonine-protein kinase
MDAVTESITQHQQRLYSLTYASAEQVLGHSINTSTDIYTVGLLLHELLTNSKYFNFEGVSRKEAEERILNQATNADHESEILLDKDLLAIRNKAIRVESDSRYNSIGELESDLRRFLNNEPVLARKGTTIYRASKFWKRNKGAVSTAAVFFIAAISFFVFYTVRISNERTIAEREAEKAQLVTDYLIGLFEQADPTGAQGKDQTVADFIQQSIDDLSGLDDNPVLQQEAIHTLAKVSLALGNIADAEILFNQALSLAKSNDSDPITLAIIFYDLGVLKETAGHYRDALSNFESAEILLEDVVSKDYGLRLSIIRSIATSHAHFGNVEQAETLLESVFNSLRTDDESVNNQRIQLLTDLADIVRESENYEASVQFDSEALSLLEVFQSENAELRIFIQNNLGYALKQLNRLDEALYYYNATLVGAEELYGTTHPRVLTTLGNISTLHVSRNDLDLSAEIDREILNRTVSAYGENHWRTGSAYGGLATALSNLRDSEAIEKIDISVSIFQDVLGYDHFWTLRQQLRQALIWYKFDKISEADALTEATVNRLTDTIQRPLAYYDKLGLERLQDLFVDAEYELGVENISEFFSWYASTIETEN